MSSSRSRLGYGLFGLNPDEFNQVLRLQAFRNAHPEVVIGDGGFGTIQAHIPEPNGETVVTLYRLAELLGQARRTDGRTSRPRG